MRLYLSSYGFGNASESLAHMVGENRKVAVIANALDASDPIARAERVKREIDGLTELGFAAEELDLRGFFGKTDDLQVKIMEFDLVWVRGGNVFLLRRAYRQSGFDQIITRLLHDDRIAYGGYSAGVCILAPTLEGIELVDPIDRLSSGYDQAVLWDGLGILDYSIAPHYKSDHPESADVDKLVNYFIHEKILFRALHDGEVIIVDGTTTVIG